ncbi:MAG: hypothetical protein OIF55_09640 [Amphritea sp.]|nr:hypothetical protein [Amphritea sp.]
MRQFVTGEIVSGRIDLKLDHPQAGKISEETDSGEKKGKQKQISQIER